MVNDLVNIGKDEISSIVVTIIEIVYSDILFNLNLLILLLMIVDMIFIDLITDDTPFRCSEKIIILIEYLL
jgi:hypothetical protein